MRPIVGVIVAFVAMALLVFALSIAPWIVFGLDAVMQPGRFDTVLAYDAYAVVVGIAGAVFAGWLCVTIARSRGALIVLAALCFFAGTANALGQMQKPEPGARLAGVSTTSAMTARKEPAWFSWLMPFVGVAGVMIGGRNARA